MAALVTKLFETLHLYKRERKCVILGLDASGKTSFLYRTYLGSLVTTIPTIGFNVETLKVGDCNLTCWDVGGCDKIRPLIRHYFSPGVAILFILDIHDGRLSEAMEELSFHVRQAFSDFDASFVGIMFNKQDLPGTTPELKEKCRIAVEATMTGSGVAPSYWRIFDSEGLSVVDGRGIYEVLEGMVNGIEGWHPKEGSRAGPSLKASKTKYRYPDAFLANMQIGKLDTWDHTDHLYVATVILHRVLNDPSQTTTPQQPVLAAVEIFLEHLISMLEEAPGKFRNTAHQTLTTFWVYRVYVAMHRFPEKFGSRFDFWPDQFWALLESCPELLYGASWKDYYTKQALFSPKAKNSLIAPDIQALPPLPDQEKMENLSRGYDSLRLEEDRTSRRLKRWAYATLQIVKATNGRRGAVVRKALAQLQTDTIRQRAKMPNLEPYSETQAYFWIQIIHAGMEGILKKNPTFDFSKVSYETVEILYPDAFGADDLWKEYYAEADWKGMAARMGFRPPRNGKIIPNFSPNLVLGRDWKAAVSEVMIPTMEELMQRADWISNYVTNKPEDAKKLEESTPTPTPTPISVNTGNLHSDDDDDDWVEVNNMAPKAPKVTPPEPKSTPKGPSAASPISTGPQSWQEHAEMIHGVFDKLPKDRSQINHRNISKVAYERVNLSHSEITKMAFWVRMIIEAYIDTYGISNTEAKEEKAETKSAPINLHDFLSRNPEICWENLWLVYYTELKWKSITANEVILGCDRKQLRSVRGWKEQPSVA
ncbi:hypothetical protein ABW20_dc0103843 [Dactylellina cionopaga]|nr:hypothetical protein ABW20_dc0103843 [Dactylellina cionopaga]